MNIPENVAGIDYRHMQLETMVDKVCEMLEYGYALFIIEAALDELLLQTETNFTEEEKLMRRYRYENLEAHTCMHKELWRKLNYFQKKLLSKAEQGNEQENKRNLLTFLETEFRDHMKEDSKALECGQVAVQHAIKRLSEMRIPTRNRMSLAKDPFMHCNAVMAFRGIFRYSPP